MAPKQKTSLAVGKVRTPADKATAFGTTCFDRHYFSEIAAVSIGHDGDGEHGDFSDFFPWPTKWQSSAPPVRRDLIPVKTLDSQCSCASGACCREVFMDDHVSKRRQTSSKQAREEAREQTDRVAMQTLEEERRLRAIKTERLRQAREAKGDSTVHRDAADDVPGLDLTRQGTSS
jgi:hypothetical protein